MPIFEEDKIAIAIINKEKSKRLKTGSNGAMHAVP
jgi:hypothetical protein